MVKASKSYVLMVGMLLVWTSVARAQSDPLPSWNDGPNKQAIVEFVASVTKDGGPNFIPVPQRIATFDNDGTLWSEQPIYFQFAFALDRVNGPTIANRTSDVSIKHSTKHERRSGSSWI